MCSTAMLSDFVGATSCVVVLEPPNAAGTAVWFSGRSNVRLKCVCEGEGARAGVAGEGASCRAGIAGKGAGTVAGEGASCTLTGTLYTGGDTLYDAVTFEALTIVTLDDAVMLYTGADTLYDAVMLYTGADTLYDADTLTIVMFTSTAVTFEALTADTLVDAVTFEALTIVMFTSTAVTFEALTIVTLYDAVTFEALTADACGLVGVSGPSHSQSVCVPTRAMMEHI